MLDLPRIGLGLDYSDLQLRRTTAPWVAAGGQLRDRTRVVLAGLVEAVEHIGSSSVVGLLAKPIIDLAVGVGSASRLAAVEARLATAGWIYRGDAGEEGGHVFVLESAPWHRVGHLHVVSYRGRQWCDYLELRDHLRSSSDARELYESVKLELVGRCADRDSYTTGKTAVVRDLLAEARSGKPGRPPGIRSGPAACSAE